MLHYFTWRSLSSSAQSEEGQAPGPYLVWWCLMPMIDNVAFQWCNTSGFCIICICGNWSWCFAADSSTVAAHKSNAWKARRAFFRRTHGHTQGNEEPFSYTSLTWIYIFCNTNLTWTSFLYTSFIWTSFFHTSANSCYGVYIYIICPGGSCTLVFGPSWITDGHMDPYKNRYCIGTYCIPLLYEHNTFLS